MGLICELLNRLRHCPSCGSSVGRTEWVCVFCLEQMVSCIHKSAGKIILSPGNIPVHFLMEWKPQDHFVSSLVYSLKGGKLSSSYKMLAEFFLLKHRVKAPLIIYPSKGSRDHAFEWSLALSRWLDADVLPLELMVDKKQSLLNQKQRQEVVFKPLKIKGNQKVLWVDDIVTSGSTAKAAWRALGQPKKFAVGSLFYRPPLSTGYNFAMVHKWPCR